MVFSKLICLALLMINQVLSDSTLKVLTTGKGSPGFILGKYDDKDDNPVCIKFLRSFETPKDQTECNIQRNVPQSERHLQFAQWVSNHPTQLLTNSKDITGADKFEVTFVNARNGDGLTYELLIQNYTFVEKDANYILELSFGLCDNLIKSNTNKNSKKRDSKSGENDSKSKKSSKDSMKTRGKLFPDSKLSKKKNQSSRSSVSRDITTSFDNGKSSKNTISNDQTTSNDDKSSGSTTSNDHSKETTSNDHSKDTTSNDSKKSNSKDSKKNSKDSDSKSKNSNSKDSDSKDSNSKSDSKNDSKKRQIEKKALNLIRLFLKTTRTEMICNGVTKQLQNSMCTNEQMKLYRIIIRNFNGCDIKQSPLSGLNVRSFSKNDGNSAANHHFNIIYFVSIVFITYLFC